MIHVEPPVRSGRIQRGARAVGWREWGRTGGRPVVFCTGAAMTSSFGFGADAIDELGLRVLCIDRAGLGLSDPDPAKSLASYAADVLAVLADQGIARPHAIGFSQGAPFAIAVAATGALGTLALVAGQDELAHPSMRSQLVPDVARMVDAIEHDRSGFEAAFATRVDAEGLWALVLGMSSEQDREVYGEPTFAAAYRATLAEGFAQGPAGYVRDLVLAMSPWSCAPERVDVPVRLWYGGRDTSPVHSPDFGHTLATRFPHAALHVLPDEGGALLWTRSADILRDLIAT